MSSTEFWAIIVLIIGCYVAIIAMYAYVFSSYRSMANHVLSEMTSLELKFSNRMARFEAKISGSEQKNEERHRDMVNLTREMTDRLGRIEGKLESITTS